MISLIIFFISLILLYIIPLLLFLMLYRIGYTRIQLDSELFDGKPQSTLVVAFVPIANAIYIISIFIDPDVLIKRETLDEAKKLRQETMKNNTKFECGCCKTLSR